MNAIVIASIVIAGSLVVGALIAVIFSWFGNTVKREQEQFSERQSKIQPSITFGHEIPVDADLDVQLDEARKLAARQAARMPRGANLRIGSTGSKEQKTSHDGIDQDPMSAVKMAYFHGWDGLKTGAKVVSDAPKANGKGVAEAIDPVKSSEDLVPGEDYPFIEITDDMSPAEKRKARIANAKAKSAAVKKAKDAASRVQTSASEEKASDSGDSKKKATASKPIEGKPEPGVDYEVIEITDDMSPDEVRKARIANAKAKSAATKRIREAGGTPSPGTASDSKSSAEKVSEQNQRDETDTVDSIPADIPQPNFIEITDDMDKDEVRKARIHNAKEKSAFNKALRAAGIDPKTVNA